MSQAVVERHGLDATMELVTFRPAGLKDVAGLTGLYRLFFDESDLPTLGLVMSDARTHVWLEDVLALHTPHIIAVEKSTRTILGSISYVLDGRGLEKPAACLDKFYVRKEWRLSGIGRILLNLAVEAAVDEGAAAFRAGISSGIGYGKNLFLKLGFKETAGSVLLARRL
jgi:GNAT superfamily N-acetyltransferase